MNDFHHFPPAPQYADRPLADNSHIIPAVYHEFLNRCETELAYRRRHCPGGKCPDCSYQNARSRMMSERRDRLGRVREMFLRMQETHINTFLLAAKAQPVVQTLMTFTGSCDVNVTVDIYYYLVEKPSSLMSAPLVAHKLSIRSLITTQLPLVVREPVYFLYRFLVMRGHPLADSNLQCFVSLHINIYQPFGVDHWQSSVNSTTEPEAAPAMFHVHVLWESRKVSWVEAERLCQSIGGHLPSITSGAEQGFLGNVVWGKYAPLRLLENPCRWITLVCAIFIGLNSSQVRNHEVYYLRTLLLYVMSYVFVNSL